MTELQITFRGMESSDSVTEWVERAVAKLARHAELGGAHVTVECRGGEHPTFTAHVQLFVPHAALVASKDADPDRSHANVWSALDDAFAGARAQLDELHDRKVARRRHRGHHAQA